VLLRDFILYIIEVAIIHILMIRYVVIDGAVPGFRDVNLRVGILLFLGSAVN
jgi:hypothetical protein